MSYSKEEKAKLLQEWRQSGKRISVFVRENGLVRWTFAKWIKAERESKIGFVEVPLQALQNTPQVPEILIEKGDIKVHIPLGLSCHEIRAVIESLRATQ